MPEDAAVDARVDAGPDGGSTLSVDCGRSVQYTAPRQPIMLKATVESSVPVTRERWTLLSAPPGSTASVGSAGNPIPFTPDEEGSYELRFETTNAMDRTATCEITVQAVVGPPVAICPEQDEIRTREGEPVEIRGDGFDDNAVVSYRWRVTASPGAAEPELSMPNSPVTQFTADRTGVYELQLTVTDEDMASDTCNVRVRVIAPPEVSCPEETIRAPTRQPVTVTAEVSDDRGIRSTTWEMVERPDGSSAEPMPADEPETELVPDRQGRYRMRLTAVDEDGLEATCLATVVGTPTPPDAVCPDTINTRPLTSVELQGDGVDDGRIVEYRWTVLSRPPGSDASEPSPQDARVASFMPDIAGVYRIELQVTDNDGQTGTCEFDVRAVASEGLRVEMSWNQDDTDMDLHLLHPDADAWFTRNDCYYINCTPGETLEWGAPGPGDNPQLDIDDTDGFGPENINVDEPQRVTYRVGVHAFRGEGLPNEVTVRIYCGGSTTEPRRTFGPVTLRGSDASVRNEFWRVADVTISATGCSIEDLSRGGEPYIRPARHAERMR
jgi:hypothetical protein